jgi:hypothetical protein
LSVEADIARGNPETVVGAPLFSSWTKLNTKFNNFLI